MALKKNFLFLLFGIFLTTLLQGAPFKVGQLPIGKTLTLPKPALMEVPGDMPVHLISEDIPQTVKISLAGRGQGRMNIAIFNDERKLTKEFKLSRGDTVLYTFDRLTTIRLVPTAEGKYTKGLKIKLESNKPLGVRR